jgi:hypothetical protein
VSKDLYHLPKKEDILRITLEILGEYGVVNSLKTLTKLVNMRAKSENSTWRIGPKRLKKIVAKSKRIKIDVITRKTEEVLAGNVKCIVCGEIMQPELNKTLDGGIIALGYKCKFCGYRTGTEKEVPIRYIFRLL